MTKGKREKLSKVTFRDKNVYANTVFLEMSHFFWKQLKIYVSVMSNYVPITRSIFSAL